jgi:dihydrolipoamide dehydrogenase
MPQHDLIIIGAGPGGYTAAIRAAQLGLDVACIDKEPALGGTCLRVGCIPSKALLESSELYDRAEHAFAGRGIKFKQLSLELPAMLSQKETVVDTLTQGIAGLFKKNKVTRYEGRASLPEPAKVIVEGNDGTVELEATNVLIATGSKPAELPGVELDFDKIGTSTEALSYESVPEHLVVIGAGYIGLELGTVWRRLGAKVTVLEYLDRILPGMDAELAKEALKIFKKQGLKFQLGVAVQSGKVDDDGKCIVEGKGSDPIACDRVLLSAGRKPNVDGLGIEALGVKTDQRGFIQVDHHYQTSVPGVYAIGDVIPGPMLAHKAEHEGVACVEQLVTGYGHVNYDVIPGVVYTEPEIATVGKTEEQLQEEGIEYNKGTFPFLANGRARALGMTEGKAKVLADKQTDRILGVHIIGPRAGDLIAEACVAMEFGASSEDLAMVCHAHPTLSEALKEAALGTAGQSLNF